MKYEVNLTYKGQTTFIVDADSEQGAIDKAIERYEPGEIGDCPANDWEEWDNAYVKEHTQ